MRQSQLIPLLVLAGTGTAIAGPVVVYENDKAGWDTAVASYTTDTIDWDDIDISNGTYTTITSNQYAGLLGSPSLSVDGGSGLFVLDPGLGFYDADYIPVSGENVFSPDVAGSPEGELTIDFDETMHAIGAWFLDVESDYTVTGIEINGEFFAFSSNQGDDSQSWLGLVSMDGFTQAKIRMAFGGGAVNGVGIDDVVYGHLIPLPTGAGLAGLGLLGLASTRRRF